MDSTNNVAMRTRRTAFTLVELLVVIGIIAVLAGLLLPATMRAFRTAARAKVSSDLNAISLALEAYKQDFGDYPRVETPGTGFAQLTKALFGPGPAIPAVATALSPFQVGTLTVTVTPPASWLAVKSTMNAPPGADWVSYSSADGADDMGFRTGPKTIDTTVPPDGIFDIPSGKVWGPYLKPETFKLHGMAMLDRNNNPILYFPASPQKINLNVVGARYVSSAALVGGGGASVFNFDDNGALAMSLTTENDAAKALARMQVMMGIRGAGITTGSAQAKGQVGSGEVLVTSPYVLWSTGSDGMFGPVDDILQWGGNEPGLIAKVVKSCDDVTNFQVSK